MKYKYNLESYSLTSIHHYRNGIKNIEYYNFMVRGLAINGVASFWHPAGRLDSDIACIIYPIAEVFERIILK